MLDHRGEPIELGPVLVWIVGVVDPRRNGVWSLEGLWTKQERAVAHCTTAFHFIAPLPVDEDSSGLAEWQGLMFPIGTDDDRQAARTVMRSLRRGAH